ncbi:MAG TPA: endonuclease/exonuclease/phosphatase family protein [Polyangiaceae bacterium]|nr:endonuclease/exonuclease/phosphatase family protein [Polyangiaceae bacterium]
MTGRLRVATLNIWNRSGPWAARLAAIRAELRRLDPCVLGLQEVLRTVPAGGSPHGAWTVTEEVSGDTASDQASPIAAGLLPHIAYGRAQDYGGGLAFGNAVLSRYPVLAHEVFELPGRESGESRSLLYALVDHPGGQLPVFVTHLNWKLHHGSVRVRQVQFICEKIKELCPLQEERLPPVLMGDFNAGPESDEIRYLVGLATIGGKSVYFADAWVYGGDGTPGPTFCRDNPFAAIAHEPSRRIDYIFVRGPDGKLRGEPVHTRVAFDKPTDTPEGPVFPSDHYGVVTDLSVDPKSWG